MRFGLFGSAAALQGQRRVRQRPKVFENFIAYNVEAEALRLPRHLRRRAPFHGTRPGLGDPQSADLARRPGTTLRLGTAVMVLPWHNPVLLAEQAATLDLLSGGRLDFGIGTGYRYNEFAGFDVGTIASNPYS